PSPLRSTRADRSRTRTQGGVLGDLRTGQRASAVAGRPGGMPTATLFVRMADDTRSNLVTRSFVGLGLSLASACASLVGVESVELEDGSANASSAAGMGGASSNGSNVCGNGSTGVGGAMSSSGTGGAGGCAAPMVDCGSGCIDLSSTQH